MKTASSLSSRKPRKRKSRKKPKKNAPNDSKKKRKNANKKKSKKSNANRKNAKESNTKKNTKTVKHASSTSWGLKMKKFNELKIINGKLTICAFVERKGTVFEYYRRTEDKILVRNLYGNCYGKMNVHIPGFKYWYDEIATEEEWDEIRPSINGNLSEYKEVSKKDIELFEKCYPNFHYVIEKAAKNYFFSYEKFFDLIPIWKKNPKVEILIDKGFSRIAFNKTFWKLKPANQKKYLQALKACEGYNPDMKMLKAVSEGTSAALYIIMTNSCFYNHNTRKFECPEDVAQYLLKKDIVPGVYVDYINMAKAVGHDTEDPYWKFPNNFQSAHNKVLDENTKIKEMENRKKLSRWEKKYIEKTKKFKRTVSKDKIKVYVPKSIFEYTNHAEKLHQCLVYCRYYERVAKGNSLLVFITKNKMPYATAELLKCPKGFKMGQFYGDEHLKDYHAQKDAVDAFNQWIAESKINIVKDNPRSLCGVA